MINLPHRFYAIAPDGLVRVTFSEEYLGPGTTILESFVKNLGVVLSHIDEEESSMLVTPRVVAIARELDEFNLHTLFRPITGPAEDKVTIVPVWTAPGSEMKLTWEVPGDMALFFVISWEHNGASPADLGMVEPECYLIARCENEKKTYLLPLPNLYDNGQICLGKVAIRGQGENGERRSAIEQLDFAIKTFLETRWNTDLIRERLANSQRMFQFDPDGKQLPPEGNWRKLCQLINHSNYQFVAKI